MHTTQSTEHSAFTLPDWVRDELANYINPALSIEERMKFVIRLSELNVINRTGGPFGAAVFDLDSGKLISVGVNLVVAAQCSIAHAEVVALSLAQKSLGSHNLGTAVNGRMELVTSTEPCAMCLGAIVWSGIAKVVCGARDEDAHLIGFDEGPKVPDWPHALSLRGIDVVRDVLRDSAANILQLYARTGGLIYNGQN